MKHASIPPAILVAVAELIEARTGLCFVDGRRSELASKVTRAYRESRCATWDSYVAHLVSQAGSPLLRQLIESLTVGETYFFRHRAYFEVLQRDVLPALIARRQATRQLRFWCAGCATGEEAYSLAILVRGLLPDCDGWQVSILATDLNRSFLAQAEAGIYGDWSFRETDERFKLDNFTREGNRYRIRPEIRQMVRFGYLNLAQDDSLWAVNQMTELDLILCRNVLICFAPEVSAQVVARMRTALVPGGWLMLGPSDPLPGLLQNFDVYRTPEVILYRRPEDECAAPVASFYRDSRLPRKRNDATGPDTNSISVCIPLAERTPNLFPTSGKDLIDGKAPWTPSVRSSPIAPRRRQSEDVDGVVGAAPDWREDCQAARHTADRGLWTEAEVHCRHAIAHAKLRPEPYYLLGTIRDAQGDDEGALQAFRQALYIDRTFVPAHLALATYYRRRRCSRQEQQALARAQRLLEGRSADEVILAEAELTVGRLRDALAYAAGNYARREDS